MLYTLQNPAQLPFTLPTTDNYFPFNSLKVSPLEFFNIYLISVRNILSVYFFYLFVNILRQQS